MRVFKFLIIYFFGILFSIAQDQNSIKNILKDQGYPLDSFHIGGTINHSSLVLLSFLAHLEACGLTGP